MHLMGKDYLDLSIKQLSFHNTFRPIIQIEKKGNFKSFTILFLPFIALLEDVLF